MQLIYNCEFCHVQNTVEVFNFGIVVTDCKNCSEEITIEVKITPTHGR